MTIILSRKVTEPANRFKRVLIQFNRLERIEMAEYTITSIYILCELSTVRTPEIVFDSLLQESHVIVLRITSKDEE